MIGLADIRVLAVEQFGAGPFGTLHLAELGAEVIKIEDARSGGDTGRGVPPFQEDGDSLFYESFNRNKRSLALDLQSPAGRSVFERLVGTADAVLHNLRGDVPEKLRLRHADLAPLNERIVVCSLSGFGMVGSRRRQPAYDYVLQGLAGWMDITGEPDGPPTKSGLSLVDYCGGLVAALSLLAGVHVARRDGVGGDCDLSLFDTAISMLSYPATWYLTEGYEVSRRARSQHPSIVPFGAFPTADGWLMLACVKPKFFVSLVEALGIDELAGDPRFATLESRRENEAELLALLDEALGRRPTAEWVELLDAAGVPCGPVNSLAEALDDPFARERGMIVETPHPRFGEVRHVRTASPRLVAGAGAAPRARARRGPRRAARRAARLRGGGDRAAGPRGSVRRAAVSESALARSRRDLARIHDLDGPLRSCILVRQEAEDEAAAVDRELSRAPLAGWTIGVKDNCDVAGTVRSDGLGPPHPPAATADAVAVARLRAAGAVVLAKTNLEQLSFGATTQNPTWGACRNPWDLERIPGGSSGGSAVAVAAGLVAAALGTDTGGSLRNPASFCGVSTLRPTHGLVPVAGVTPLSPSMDVVGPIARRVADLRRLLAVLAARPAEARPVSLSHVSIGVPREYFLDELEAGVAGGFDALLDLLRSCGVRLVAVSLPGSAEVPEAMSKLQNSEAAGSLRAYWEDPRLEDGIRERLDLGRAVGDRERELAARTTGAWRRAVGRAFERVEAIVTPATPFVAPPAAAGNLVQLSRRINRTTGCWSVTGGPALVLPLPRSAQGLPVGGQLVGPAGSDWRLLALGEAIQSASDWHLATPPQALAGRTCAGSEGTAATSRFV